MKKILIITGMILAVVLVAAGSFWGGMAYQTNQANQARTNFLNARGQVNGGQLPGDGTGFPTGGGFGGGGTAGQVKSIDGNVMTISTAQDVTTVNLSESTQIEKTVAGTTVDLQPGTRVMVTGQRDSNGNITASQITIITNVAAGAAYPPPATQEP